MSGTRMSESSGFTVTRRSVIKGLGVGAAGVFAGPLLSACTGASPSKSGSANAKSTSVGSNFSDAVPKKAFADVVAAFKKKEGIAVRINTTPHNDFQSNINNYLQGGPDPVFSWFAGNRMKFFAAKGLLTPTDDIWSNGLDANYSDAIKKASTAADGKKYLVPWVNYPWAVWYSTALFKSKGYQVPKTWDEWMTLMKKMKGDGLVPLAFASKDGWPPFGTFDYIDMRLNGYDFHEALMAHQQPWTDKRVKDVFKLWKSILPYSQPAANGRIWQDAVNTLAAKKAGMMVLGSDQAVPQWPKERLSDLAFFPFPTIREQYGQDAVEAPIDGFLLSKKGAGDDAAAKLITYLGSGAAQITYLSSNPSDVATAKDADTSGYNHVQKAAVKLIADAKQISQFLDRDALPTFASNAAIPGFQSFIGGDSVDSVTSNLEGQAKQLYPAK